MENDAAQARADYGTSGVATATTWKILIADDEEEVHAVTKLVLRGLTFEGSPVEFLDAHSAAETRTIFDSGAEIAVLLLDVVMEDEHSGLDVVRYLRETRRNHSTRIILRTGQPGRAPERSVIAEYDINDYKEKSELSSVKLYSCVLTAMRSYRDIMSIDSAKRGLEKIIGASSTLFRTEVNLSGFAAAVLEELDALLQTSHSFFLVRHASFAAISTGRDFEIVSGTSGFREYLHKTIDSIKEEHVHELVEKAIESGNSLYLEREFVGYFRSKLGFETILYISMNDRMSELDRNLLHVFSTSITLAFDNLVLNRDIADTQKEILYTIGDVVESRSKETANHVKRVTEFAVLLAERAGLDPESRALLYGAAPMHDLGKIGIPDALMLKPGPLESPEWETMKTHTLIGHDILGNSRRELLRAAGIIAHQHHERWDGSGYPQGLAGEDIHVFARIVAIVDVFDALVHRRSYKAPWPLEKARDYIDRAGGSQFDPVLARLFIRDFSEYIEINERFPDSADSNSPRER